MTIGNGILVTIGDREFIERVKLMQVNDLGFIATILFVLVPTVFLLILYIQTTSSERKQ
ncbi:photosystem II reaction center protein PsbM [Sivoneniella epilithica]